VAVASAGPYVSLHLAPDRQPCRHPTTQLTTYGTYTCRNYRARSTCSKCVVSPYTVGPKFTRPTCPAAAAASSSYRSLSAAAGVRLTSAANPPAAAAVVDRRDRQSDGRTDRQHSPTSDGLRTCTVTVGR